MRTEIERKFRLPLGVPEYVATDPVWERIPISQGYLKAEKDGELRIRKKGDQYFATIKGGGGLVREEAETKISEKLFRELSTLVIGQIIQKKRIMVPGRLFPGSERVCTFEVDVYENQLAGLAVVEIEFQSERDATAFISPPWMEGAQEVTEDTRFKNKNLALSPEDVGEFLTRH